MVVTKDVKLPEFSELNVDECNISTATLMSAAPYVGKHCESVNNEFMLCRYELNDPRACIEIGKKVTACTLQLFRQIKDNCKLEFNQYANCIDKSSGNYTYNNCRKTQAVFDTCMDQKLCMQRPGFGYFCRARIHQTSRPAPTPEKCPCEPRVPDPTPSLPDCKPRPPSRFGNRLFWTTE
ncbi:NADH dehydrogenase [ubiquinone] 1 alpha subcomplex subunit 8-like [Pararge aegeria]|uniref:Jg21454 protein n=1 Tax=Pararge aegeria aegeria TaxID=348720 RepID=A0A8S4R4L5_9NEOP|nr:NADH dehydrogenase [ubiquinone] 1 alpha subcomplex subunit 8-like [Pararge aegeria]CAH2231625.1 jg21454 [Pararge aegeria aegeria]